jgi:hypothetical protein
VHRYKLADIDALRINLSYNNISKPKYSAYSNSSEPIDFHSDKWRNQREQLR